MSFWQFLCGLTAGFTNGMAAARGCYPMCPPPPFAPHRGRFMPFPGGLRQPFILFNNAASSLIGGGIGMCYWGGGSSSSVKFDKAAIDAQVEARVNASMLQISFQNVSSDYTKITAMIKSITKALEDNDSKLTNEMKTDLEALKTELEAQKEALQPYIDKAKEGDTGDTKLEDVKSAHESANAVVTKAETSLAKIKRKLAEAAEAEEEDDDEGKDNKAKAGKADDVE